MAAPSSLPGILIALGSAALIAGCAGDNLRDLERYIQDVKSRPSQEIDPIPEIPQIATFTYVGEGKRDPFSPLGDQQQQAETGPSSAGPRPDFLRRKEELEQFPLDSLRMVGTLEQQELNWALVRSTDGVIHRVKAGNYMGQNHGQITRITEDQIELTEIVPDGQGGYRERQASLDLTE
jgi:type IV pilus assembly protein PilP